MDTWPIVALMIIVGIVFVGVLVALVVYRKRHGIGEVDVNYRPLFVLGICLLFMGALLSFLINPGMIGIMALGAFYIVLSLSNRDKWKS